MKTNIFILVILSSFLLSSCTIEPSKIEYGKDACHYCKMNIVDKKHAAQIVTKKGKNYKYDAAECFLNDLKNRDQNKIGLFLVTDYVTPEKLVDATQATFLISASVQSPMGENLSSFELKENAITIINENNNGVIYTWHNIQQLFNTKLK